MSDPELIVIAGALARSLKPKVAQTQDALAKRWRTPAQSAPVLPAERKDVIPLMDGWIKVLERAAGITSAPPAR